MISSDRGVMDGRMIGIDRAMFSLDEASRGTAFGRLHPQADFACLDQQACAEAFDSVKADFRGSATRLASLLADG